MKTLISLIFSLSVSLTVSANHNSSESVVQRIAPVGQLKVMTAEELEALEEEEEEDTEVAAEDQSGEAVYSANCLACHGAGIAGAPKTGDVAAWTERIGQGMDILVEHAIAGYQGSKGVMPAKGGNPKLSDAAVTAAVEYMAEQSQ